MNKQAAINLVKDTFEHPYDRDRFVTLTKNILHSFEPATFVYRGNYIPDAYKKHIKTLERIGKYEDQEGNKIDILAVSLVKESTLGRARTLQRNFISWYLNGSRGDVSKDAALVAFYVEEAGDWRLSLVKMDYRLDKTDTGKLKTVTELTPARRFSFLVGEQENSHTAQRQILPLLQREETPPTLTDLENTFSVEVVTKEFFEKYKQLFLTTKEALDKAITKDEKIKQDFEEKHIDSVDFTKKLLGQIVFLYFLQKKGWFGVSRDDTWGSGPKDFLRLLFEQQIASYDNFFNDILEPLFYEALAIERSGDFYSRFNCKIPFLNGGLFDPLHNYDWIHTDIHLPNDLFSNQVRTKDGDVGNGILDVFDRYNFTVKEDEPLEKEVAVDPEMLGKVFENLLEVKDRKSKGTYYTPREIVHYMCQESLVNYLVTKLQGSVDEDDIRTLVRIGETAVEHDTRVVETGMETDTYSFQLPENVRSHAKQIDEALKEIKACDPAVGSGAFLVGMMSEIIRLRNTLTSYLENGDRSIYGFKHHAIQNSLYGVDIDPGAIEIAKLRLWLSLIVDEQDIRQIKPLPNLDYKIMQGNSLLEEFEGIKLFDEELLTQPKFDNSAQVKDIKERINELQRQFFELHAKREFHGAKRQEIETELAKLNRTLKRLTKEPKPKAENASLFDQVSEAKQKADQLKKLHTEFFDTAHKNEKDRIKKQIEQLTWELIEATLREQNKSSLVKQIEKFRQSNVKPFFLWKLNFSEVFENGNSGFDVIVGNPPYGATLSKDEKQIYKKIFITAKTIKGLQKGSLDTYTLFIELGHNLMCLNGNLAYIVPMSITSSDSVEGVHRLLNGTCKTIKVVSFSNRPTQIFQNAGLRVSLLFIEKNNTKCKSLFTTKLLRKRSIDSIQDVLDSIKFINSVDLKLVGRYPKISEPTERTILKKIFSQKQNIRQLLEDDGFPIYYRTSGGRYFNVVTNYKTGSTKEKPLYFPQNIQNVVGLILSSSLFWFYQQVYSNGIDIKSYEVESFPIPTLPSSVLTQISDLYSTYLSDIERNAKTHQTNQNSSYTVSSFKEYKIQKSKVLIDKIDGLVCSFYGLDKNETDFIKNYESEYRFNDSDEEGLMVEGRQDV